MTSVTKFYLYGVVYSTGGDNTNAGVATTDIGFDMSMCFKNGTETTAALKGLTCWIMSFDKATTATGAAPANGKYDIRVYNVQSLNTTITHATTDIAWLAGNVTTGGPEKTSSGFYDTNKWAKKIKLVKAD
jgi:hypothetical protein